ncbi:MAG: peptide MFS transporter [Bryobacteraceae bacterium]|nr:peptide MFS transporter [Bryobacteraceae bacterium]
MPEGSEAQLFGHPRGLTILFFTEMWERFSYYGMRSLLILFMTANLASGGLGLDTPTAAVIYGLFTAMVYLMALPGGWIADRITGHRKAVLVGGILISLGDLVLALPGLGTFYGGLVLVVIGTGLLKPNVSTIVGQLYTPEDRRRDSGFSIFYMGINLGAFLSPFACGWAAAQYGWRAGFALASVCMALGTFQYLSGSRTLGNAGVLPATPNDKAARQQFLIGTLLLTALIGLVFFLSVTGTVSPNGIVDASGALLLLIVTVFFGWLLFGAKGSETDRKRLVVIFFLFLAACVFWSVFEQAGSSLTLFAERNTDNKTPAFQIQVPWYQSVQPFFIITLAPVFGAIWLWLGRFEPSSPAKFAWGLIFVGIGFLILVGGASLASAGVRVSPFWLVATYFFHTCGELCLSPVGLSAMTKLAPARVAGLMMGVYFLSISVGNYVGGRLAAFYGTLPLPVLFGAVGLFAVAAGLLLALFVKPMVRLMAGVK